MKISRATKAYDANALNKPWIAPVTLDPFNQYDGPDFDNPIKGAFIGNEGEAGELVIEIKAGSAVAFGQASKREGICGTTSFGIVQEDGTLQEVDRKALVEHLLARRAAGHITPIERCRLSAVANTVIKNGHLRPGDYSDDGVLSQKELIQIMALRSRQPGKGGMNASGAARSTFTLISSLTRAMASTASARSVSNITSISTTKSRQPRIAADAPPVM